MQMQIKGISSMATRQVLAELALAYEARAACKLAIESVGGVDAARRVQAGEPFDLVFLASDAIDKLVASGRVLAASKVNLVESPVAIAVRQGAPRPDIATEAALRSAVLAAASIGYSTGPSGTALLQLFDRWGITRQLAGRVVQAPAGVPVGSLVAKGEVELGFQQLSELLHLQGIAVLGVMPPGVEIVTTFAGGVVAGTAQALAARGVLAFMASAEADAAKRRHGMEPARQPD